MKLKYILTKTHFNWFITTYKEYSGHKNHTSLLTVIGAGGLKKCRLCKAYPDKNQNMNIC